MVTKAKRLVRGSVLGAVSFFLRVFISLFMTPFMIASFGDHSYGLWILVASFSGFYGILDLGLSTAVQRYMARSVGAEDHEEANTVFNTSLVVFCGIGALAMILAGALAWLAPLFVKNASDVPIFRFVLLLMSVNVIVSFPMRSFWGILGSNLRYDISVYLEIANVTVKALLIVGVLKLGFGIVTVAATNLCADMLWNAANIFYALRITSYIRISRNYINLNKIKTFLSYSIYVFLSRIASLVKFNIDNYVISAFVGLSAVTVYSIGIRIVGYSTSLFHKLLGLMMPVFSQFEGQGNFEAIRRNFFFLFKIGIYIATFFGGLLFLLSRPFIERWVGPGYEEANMIILIFVVPSVFGMFMSPSNQMLYGTSKHKFLTWVNCTEALANLTLSLIFVQFWGIKGVALGTAIPSIIARVFVQPVYTAHVLKVNVFSFYARIFWPVIKALAVIIIVFNLTKMIIAVSFVRLIAAGAIQTVCYAAIMFKIGFSKSEQELLLSAGVPDRLKDWIQRRRK